MNKEVLNLFFEMCEIYGLPTKSIVVKTKDPDSDLYLNDFYTLDNTFEYGGYVIRLVHKHSGGVSHPFKSQRLSKKEMCAYLHGLIDANKFKK